jgi:glycosyltransferase involved in cell wall biosynthesis
MRLCFVDLTDWDYNVDAPTVGPLGGSQSALCYLAVALAKVGHTVTVMSGTKRPAIVSGVECINARLCSGAFFRERKFDAVIVLNSSSGSKRRSDLPPSTKLILWTQHETVQPAMCRLAVKEISENWDGIVCVSDWQRNSYIETFGLAPDRLTTIRNAIAPSFEGLFRSPDDLVRAKSNPLTLAYTSTPYRGLKHLLDIFPEYRRSNPEAKLSVFSSMAVYRKHEVFDAEMFSGMYDALRSTDGVEYVGSLPQPALAERLAHAHILAYPNIFPETSCIAVMEAMAAGMRVVTSDFAALPETTEGFADLVPIDFKDEPKYVRDYTRAIVDRPYSIETDAAALYAQAVHMNRHHTWAIRARQWAEYLN